MGKKQKKNTNYHPNLSHAKGSDPNKRQKLGEGQDKVVTKNIEEAKRERLRSLSFVDDGLEVIYVDPYSNTKDTQSQYTQLKKDSMEFDFNSQKDFNPDSDCKQVGLKLWNWLLNPMTFEQFTEEILNQNRCLVISRSSLGFSYDQSDPYDNIIDTKMIMEYFKEGQAEVKYGTHIDLEKYLNQKQYKVNGQQESLDLDFFNDAFDTQNIWLRLMRPQEFSISLTKAMCLTEELFCTSSKSHAIWQKYVTDKKYRLTNKCQQNDFDQYFMVISGDIFFYIFDSNVQKQAADKEESSVWNGHLRKGDLIYIPKGVRYQMKSKIKKNIEGAEVEDSCLMLVLQNQFNNQWKSLINSSFTHNLSHLLYNDQMNHSMPVNIFDKGKVQEENFKTYCQLIDQVASQLKTQEAFHYGLHKQQETFLQNRQAPQEILQPNEEEVPEGDNDEGMDEDGSDEYGEEQEEPQLEMIKTETAVEGGEKRQMQEFTEVKLCTKHGAFLSKRKNGYRLYYSTQNTRIPGEVPKQKMTISDKYASAIDQVIAKYPQYLKVDKLANGMSQEDKEGLVGLLNELAYLQILVVQ